MLYVTRLIRETTGPGYPFTVSAIAATREWRFEAPVTVICGDNGSGKSTLLSILAAKLNAVRIGQGIIEREQAAARAQDAFTLHKRASRRNFFFSMAEKIVTDEELESNELAERQIVLLEKMFFLHKGIDFLNSCSFFLD